MKRNYLMINRQYDQTLKPKALIILLLFFMIPYLIFGQSKTEKKKKSKGLLHTKVVIETMHGLTVRGILKEMGPETLSIQVAHPWPLRFMAQRWVTLNRTEILSIKARKITMPRGQTIGAAVGFITTLIIIFPPATGIAGAADVAIMILGITGGTISGALIEALASKRLSYQIDGDEDKYGQAKAQLANWPRVTGKGH